MTQAQRLWSGRAVWSRALRGVMGGAGLLLCLASWQAVGANAREATQPDSVPQAAPRVTDPSAIAIGRGGQGATGLEGMQTRSTGAPPGIGKGDLDSLLQLPTGFMGRPVPSVAGTSETEWRRRFRAAGGELIEAQEALSATRRELDGIAETGGASQWSVAPPGAGNSGNGSSSSPLSFRLRQELVRNRERVEAAEKALRDLRIEADLAGVPAGWRDAPQKTPEARPN